MYIYIYMIYVYMNMESNSTPGRRRLGGAWPVDPSFGMIPSASGTNVYDNNNNNNNNNDSLYIYLSLSIYMYISLSLYIYIYIYIQHHERLCHLDLSAPEGSAYRWVSKMENWPREKGSNRLRILPTGISTVSFPVRCTTCKHS